MGKSADDLVGFKYPAGGGHHIGVYKQPEKVATTDDVYVRGNQTDRINISVGNIGKNNFAPENPYGVKQMKGFGAATKGKKISGKQG